MEWHRKGGSKARGRQAIIALVQTPCFWLVEAVE